MKPTANLFRAKANVAFTQEQIEFLESISTLNPEPQIIACFKSFPDVKGVLLYRLITWKALTAKGKVTDKLFDRQDYPFSISLEKLSREINETNFRSYLKHVNATLEDPINFKILDIEWFLRLEEIRNPFAPPYASKWLSSGLKFNLNKEKLTVAFQVVNRELWWTSQHNEIKIIPLTIENLDTVIGWQTNDVKKYLKERK